MQFGYTIIYVEDVRESLAFFEQAFGLQARFIDPTGCYGEVDTGATALAFAAHSLMADLLPEGYRAPGKGRNPWAWKSAYSPTMWKASTAGPWPAAPPG